MTTKRKVQGMVSLSEVSLYPATREQLIASWKRTAVEWGTGLTPEEYVDRELVGEKREFAKDGKNVTWYVRFGFYCTGI